MKNLPYTAYQQQFVEKYVWDPIEKDKYITLDEKLKDTLTEEDAFENTEELKQREEVLGRLNLMINEFIRTVVKSHSEYHNDESIHGELFTFGSYRLGVHSRGADIDTLCVAPSLVTRKDFFTVFYDMLDKCSLVTELVKVEEAYVPIIKITFSGIHIDMLFCSLSSYERLPKINNLLDNKILYGMDEKCVLSVNGSRTTDQILTFVTNADVYRMVLRAFKMWAQRKGIYGNVFGYIGGVACAILVAKVSQLYKSAPPSFILSMLFKLYSRWPWETDPVLLKNVEHDPKLDLKVWSPIRKSNEPINRMSVITPAYPSICSTHNVNRSTLHLMSKEFNKARALTKNIIPGKNEWKDLFAPTDFFKSYKNFVQIAVIVSDPKASKLLVGYVESRIRYISLKIETLTLQNINVYAIPYNQSISLTCEDSSSASVNKRLKLPSTHINLTEETLITPKPNISEPTTSYTVTLFYLGIAISKRSPNPNLWSTSAVDLTVIADRFAVAIRSWASFDTDKMSIYITSHKRQKDQ